MKCIIIGSGEMYYSSDILVMIQTCPLIIAADGGGGHLRRLNIVPHVLIGDFDSINEKDKAYFQDNGVTLLSYPPQKDKTDSELCIDYALEKGVTDITLLGVTGTRLDHTMANIFLLRRLSQKGIPARIINRTNEIHIVTDTISLSGQPGEYLSIIPITEKAEGITLQGLLYPLNDATIPMGSTLGISNCFKEKTATIKLKDGILIVARSKDGLESH